MRGRLRGTAGARVGRLGERVAERARRSAIALGETLLAAGEHLRLAAQDHVEEIGGLTRSDDHLAACVFGEAAELDELEQKV